MDDRERIWTRRFEMPVLVAARLVILVITIEQTAHDQTWRHAAALANWIIWGVFLAEFVLPIRRLLGAAMRAADASVRASGYWGSR